VPPKLKVVLDTNVLVSGFINPLGPPGRILKALRQKKFVLVTTPSINQEILTVLNRPRLQYKYGLREHLFDAAFILWEEAQVIPDPAEVKVSRDPDDNKFLAAARAGSANYLVTGDINDLLILGRYENTRIVSPAQFMDLLTDPDFGTK